MCRLNPKQSFTFVPLFGETYEGTVIVLRSSHDKFVLIIASFKIPLLIIQVKVD